MLRRQFVLVVLILAHFSIGFTQSLGDFAREERARRNDFAGKAVPVKTTATPDVSPAKPDVPPAKLEMPAAKPEAPTAKPEIPPSKPEIPAPKPDVPPAKQHITPARPNVSEALVTEAVRVSGARRQLKEAIETFRPSLAAEKQPDDVTAKEYRQIIKEALELDRLTQVMEQSVSETVDNKTLTDIVRWYASALGRKIATAEINAYSPDTPALFDGYAMMLQKKAPTTSRRELVEGIGAAGLGVPRPSVDVDNDTWLLFVYDSLSDPELAGYLAFLKAPSADTFNNAVWDGIDAAFGNAAQHFQEMLADKDRR